MIDQKHNAPRRYFVDAQGHRVLIGLSLEETAEFEALDPSSKGAVFGAADIRGGGKAAAAGDVRWLELYSKHESAWRTWIAQSQAAQARDLSFVNYV